MSRELISPICIKIDEDNIHKPPLSLTKKLSISEGTIINSNVFFNMSYLNSNPGPYTVQNGTIDNPIIITFDLIVDLNKDTFFIIDTDYVSINSLPSLFSSTHSILSINNILLYPGLVLNLNNSNITINGLTIEGTNSTLEEGAGWIGGNGFGSNGSNNTIKNCINNLPVDLYCGGIVGQNSKVDILSCTNNGEILLNPLTDSNNNNLPSYSGGIYGYNSEGNVDSCINNGNINGITSAGIIGYTDKNFNVTNCVNNGNINIRAGGIIGIIIKNTEFIQVVNITKCTNNGTIGLPDAIYNGTNYRLSAGIIYLIETGTISDCINNGDINNAAGIVSKILDGVNLENCSNSGNMNINSYVNSGIILILTGSIKNCSNYGNISGNYASGIVYETIGNLNIDSCSNSGIFIDNKIFEDNLISGILAASFDPDEFLNVSNCINYSDIIQDNCAGIVCNGIDNINISNCINYGNIIGNSSSGIANFTNNTLLPNISNCKNYGNIIGEKSSGILASGCNGTLTNCSNDGNIEANNAGGIVGQDSIANVYNCINSGKINGIGAGGIYGAGCAESVIVQNSTNNGEINGIDSGGVYGAWCTGYAEACINTGSILGVSTGGIFGEFSTGISINSVNSAKVIAVNSRAI
jgi:hypothetical protein